VTISRNDPCPCGSGRKYKKCHLLIEEESRPAPEPMRSPLHEIDNRFVERVAGWAHREFGRELEDAAQMLEALEQQEGGLELLIPWMIYHCPIRGLPPFEWYVRAHETELSRRERDWVGSQRASWLGVWEVQESVHGRSMTLTDLLTGERRLVQEASASRSVVARDALLARVVDLGYDSVLCGMHPRSLPPTAAAEIVDDVRRSLREELPLPPERLRDPETIRGLIEIWQDVVDEEDERRSVPPELQNTDGDKLVLVCDRYRVKDEHREQVLRALASIRGADEIHEDEEGASFIGFVKSANGETTLVGHASLTREGDLAVETNSVRRAKSLRAKVENACRGLLSDHRRERTDPRALLRDAAGAPPEPHSPSEDEAAVIREEKRLHYESWLDLPVPMFGGKTPRAAARSRRGREDLVILLKSLENREARQPAETRFDVGVLRRALKIEE